VRRATKRHALERLMFQSFTSIEILAHSSASGPYSSSFLPMISKRSTGGSLLVESVPMCVMK
jgi:hypothetical protein